MKGLLFWTFAILLLAGVVHLGYVLIVPQLDMRAGIDELRRLTGGGALTVLSRDDSIRVMGPDGRWLVHALCVYDLTDGPLAVSAMVPATYWSMAIYSASGETFYSLNDRQADVDQVDLLIRQSSAPLLGEDQELVLPEGDVFTVRAPDPEGVVVMRALAGEPAEYERASRILARSSCRSAPG